MEKLETNTRGPHLGMLAIIFACLFITGLSFVITFSENAPHYPGPWESAETISNYFRNYRQDVIMCAFFQFGAAMPLGLFTATIVSRMKFLETKAAGANIALFGGFMTAFNLGVSSLILWVMSYPGIAQDATINRALYYMVFSIGGVGYSVPLGLLIAGISVTAFFMKLLPKWLTVFGLLLAVIGELSWVSLIFPKLLPLIPLTRFPGFIWLIITGFMLPKAIADIPLKK
jgi:hypothetical protein